MILLRVALALLVLGAVIPELSRYVAERRLYRASAMIRSILANPRVVPDPVGAVTWASAMAAGLAADLPGDWRPLNLAGTGLLIIRKPDAALARYLEGLALGERPELAVNAGRAWAGLGRDDLARAAFLRAGWVSPGVLVSLSAATRDAIEREVKDMEDRLAGGHLPAPPALPP